MEHTYYIILMPKLEAVFSSSQNCGTRTLYHLPTVFRHSKCFMLVSFCFQLKKIKCNTEKRFNRNKDSGGDYKHCTWRIALTQEENCSVI